jgi:hypothetical protein
MIEERRRRPEKRWRKRPDRRLDISLEDHF